MAELLTGPRPADSPSIPSWDDTLHVQLRRPITAQTLLRLQRERPGYEDDTLSAADRKWWRDRAAMIDRAEKSGVPYWRQSMTGVITALDNVQDIVATAAWMGGPLLRRLGKIGTLLHGQVKEGAVVLNTMERSLGGPLPTGREKHKHMNERKANARKRTGLIGGLQRGLDWFGKSQGHLLEAAQASDTLFGVGLTLGAVMGALEETYWRTGQKAYYTAMTAANAAIAELAGLSRAGQAAAREATARYAAIGLEVAPAPPIEWATTLWDQIQNPSPLVRTWAAWAHHIDPLLSDFPLSEGETALLALAGAGASLATAPAVSAIAGALSSSQIRDLLVPPPRVNNEATRAMLEMLGAPIDEAGVAGGAWAAPEITLEEHTDLTLKQWLRSAKPWLPADPTSNRAQLIHQLVEANAPATAALLTGDASSLHDRTTPEDQFLFHTIELHVQPPWWAPRALIEGWINHMLEAQAQDPDAWRAKSFRELSTAYWAAQGAPTQTPGRFLFTPRP